MKQNKKTRVSTRLSLYIQTQISVVVDSIIWGFIVDFIFLQMKIKKETSNAMLMWVTFLLIERGIIAEQTEKKTLSNDSENGSSHLSRLSTLKKQHKQ